MPPKWSTSLLGLYFVQKPSTVVVPTGSSALRQLLLDQEVRMSQGSCKSGREKYIEKSNAKDTQQSHFQEMSYPARWPKEFRCCKSWPLPLFLRQTSNHRSFSLCWRRELKFHPACGFTILSQCHSIAWPNGHHGHNRGKSRHLHLLHPLFWKAILSRIFL